MPMKAEHSILWRNFSRATQGRMLSDQDATALMLVFSQPAPPWVSSQREGQIFCPRLWHKHRNEKLSFPAVAKLQSSANSNTSWKISIFVPSHEKLFELYSKIKVLSWNKFMQTLEWSICYWQSLFPNPMLKLFLWMKFYLISFLSLSSQSSTHPYCNIFLVKLIILNEWRPNSSKRIHQHFQKTTWFFDLWKLAKYFKRIRNTAGFVLVHSEYGWEESVVIFDLNFVFYKYPSIIRSKPKCIRKIREMIIRKKSLLIDGKTDHGDSGISLGLIMTGKPADKSAVAGAEEIQWALSPSTVQGSALPSPVKQTGLYCHFPGRSCCLTPGVHWSQEWSLWESPLMLTMENLNVALRIESMPSMESQFHHADMLLERMELKWLNQKHQTQMWKMDPLLLQLNTLSWRNIRYTNP